MCGIAGILGAAASENTVLKLLEKQRHRGPDAEEYWCQPGIALGHNAQLLYLYTFRQPLDTQHLALLWP